MNSTPRASASVLLLRESAAGGIEVLLQRRREGLAFGGLWAFPGGVVEPQDGTAGSRDALEAAARRETQEETGVELVAARTPLIAWSRWITPEHRPRRFDTWFFACRVPENASVRIADAESLALEWSSPQAGIEAGIDGRMPMLPPTCMSLIELQRAIARHGSLTQLMSAESQRCIVPLIPAIVREDASLLEALMPWDAQHPGRLELQALPAHLHGLPSRLRLARAARSAAAPDARS